jgi:hypothetical protein
MAEWQSIKTAPKDGTFILLWIPWLKQSYAGRWYRERWVFYRTSCVRPVTAPTHWQPLPDPPST